MAQLLEEKVSAAVDKVLKKEGWEYEGMMSDHSFRHGRHWLDVKVSFSKESKESEDGAANT